MPSKGRVVRPQFSQLRADVPANRPFFFGPVALVSRCLKQPVICEPETHLWPVVSDVVANLRIIGRAINQLKLSVVRAAYDFGAAVIPEPLVPTHTSSPQFNANGCVRYVIAPILPLGIEKVVIRRVDYALSADKSAEQFAKYPPAIDTAKCELSSCRVGSAWS